MHIFTMYSEQAEADIVVSLLFLQVQLVKEIQSASRQLCKRQINWFRDDPLFTWVDARQPLEAVVEEVALAIDQTEHAGNIQTSCCSMVSWSSIRDGAIAMVLKEWLCTACHATLHTLQMKVSHSAVAAVCRESW